MMKRLTIIAGFAAMFISAAIASVAIAQNAGDPARGEQLYFDYSCYACHGYGGIGRRNIANKSSGVLISEQVFLIYLRARGDQNPQFPAQTMPHYPESSLSDDDARHIYAFISTFVDNPPEVDDIPALKEILEDTEKGL